MLFTGYVYLLWTKSTNSLKMNILIRPNDAILAILGRAHRFKSKNYRLNQFCLIEDIMNGKVIFNHLTCSMVFMTNTEYAKILDKDSNDEYIRILYDWYFLVEEDFDEKQFIKDFRKKQLSPIDDFTLDKVYEYTILTTTACNARCFYCYEHGTQKKTMTVETAKKVAQYIINHSPENYNIELRWFGGEPLFNAKVINTICTKLQEANIPYHSHFTTNGYLFDKDLIKRAVELWHVSECQITIDGTEEVYNKAKNYIYKNVPSPYKRILDNIEELMNNKITVTVRMNVDLYNVEDLKDLTYELYQRFGNNPYLHPYLYPIFENENYQRKEGELSLLFEKIKDVERVMEECGYMQKSSPARGIRFNHCMVDNGKSITVSPNGEFGLCEHFIDSDFWGHVDRPEEKNMEVIESYRHYMPDLDICEDCPIYPTCVRNSKCEEQSKCYPEYKEWLIRHKRKGIIDTYYQILSNRNNKN